MKFLCDRGKLEAALTPVLAAIPAKESTRPVLKFLHLRANDDGLLVQGTNGELSVETRLEEVKVEAEGACLVPARQFFAIVHEVPDPTVRAEHKAGKLLLPSSTSKFEIVTSAATEFPELTFASEQAPVDIPAEILLRHVQCTEFACAKEASRYAMNGILLSLQDGKLTTVATDGRRLSIISSPIDDPRATGMNWQVLLPHKSLTVAVRALAGFGDGPVAVRVTDTAVSMSSLQASVQVLRLTGAFPEFQNVIPRKCSNVVEFNRALLEANVRRALVLTDELNPAIKVAFEGMRATIESEATGVGSVRTTMDVDLSGPGGRIIFNPHFLIDALRVVETDQVRFEFEDASSPGKFVLGEEYLYVVMPITGV